MHAHTLDMPTNTALFPVLIGRGLFSRPPRRHTHCTFTGGYTLRNVARCWCFETSRMLGLDLPDQLPDSVSLLPVLLLFLLLLFFFFSFFSVM